MYSGKHWQAMHRESECRRSQSFSECRTIIAKSQPSPSRNHASAERMFAQVAERWSKLWRATPQGSYAGLLKSASAALLDGLVEQEPLEGLLAQLQHLPLSPAFTFSRLTEVRAIVELRLNEDPQARERLKRLPFGVVRSWSLGISCRGITLRCAGRLLDPVQPGLPAPPCRRSCACSAGGDE